MEPTPYLRNRRTGVILPYNPHLATHPDMVACDELPYPKEVKQPTTPTHRRHLADKARKAEMEKAEKAQKQQAAEKAEKQIKPPRKKTAETKSAPSPTGTPGDAEIDDLLTGIEHG